MCVTMLVILSNIPNAFVSINASTPEYFSPRFQSVEDLVEWIETEDAENFQSGRYRDCLLASRSRGEIFFPYFDFPDVRMTQIVVSPQGARVDAGNMLIFIEFASLVVDRVTATVNEIKPELVDAYEAEGIYGFFRSIRGGVVFGEYLISERTMTFRDLNTGELVERNVPYIVNSGLSPDGEGILTIFVVDGMEFRINYTNELAVEFINSLTWDRVAINPSAPTRPSTTINNPPVTQRPTAIDHFPTTPPTTTPISPTSRTIRFTIGNNNYTINGISHTNDVAPFIDVAHGRTMIPLRAVIEAFDAEVEWNPTARTVQIFTDTGVHQLTIDTPLPGGMGVPVIREERVFVPLSYVAGLLGAYPRWDGENSAAYIYQDVTS